jgi:hypothetical protein
MFKFTDYMNIAIRNDMGYQQVYSLVLKSGLQLSVQAGKHAYCTPRKNATIPDFAIYSEFEIGYPTSTIPELENYSSDGEIFNYVPGELIQEIVDTNGGIVGFYDNFIGKLILAPKLGGVVCFSTWKPTF